MEGEAALHKATARWVVRVWVGNTEFVADLGEELDQVGCNKVPGPESHILLVPAAHKIPSKQNTQNNFRKTAEKRE